jgi:ubiquinone/menaquinone biosynthesis C-methylase UbiE
MLKEEVRKHWEKETCGTRYGSAENRRVYFDELSAARYTLEPHIQTFADFPASKGKSVLEIGVGAGADFLNWCVHAGHVTGLDLTQSAVDLTRERLILNSVPTSRYALFAADAEDLPFDNGVFDLVYSWGTLHHTPDTERSLAEAFRVLKPGGTIKLMVYHAQSWTGLYLYLRFGVARGRLRASTRELIGQHLESPGTKAYLPQEIEALLRLVGFSDISAYTQLGPSDLLRVARSEKYESALYRFIWGVYPRWLVRLAGHRYGLYLLVRAGKGAGRPARDQGDDALTPTSEEWA